MAKIAKLIDEVMKKYFFKDFLERYLLKILSADEKIFVTLY